MDVGIITEDINTNRKLNYDFLFYGPNHFDPEFPLW